MARDILRVSRQVFYEITPVVRAIKVRGAARGRQFSTACERGGGCKSQTESERCPHGATILTLWHPRVFLLSWFRPSGFFFDEDRALRAVLDGQAGLLHQLGRHFAAVQLVGIAVVVQFEEFGGDDEAAVVSEWRRSDAEYHPAIAKQATHDAAFGIALSVP